MPILRRNEKQDAELSDDKVRYGVGASGISEMPLAAPHAAVCNAITTLAEYASRTFPRSPKKFAQDLKRSKRSKVLI